MSNNKSKKSVKVKLEKGSEREKMPREAMVDPEVLESIMINKPIKKDESYLWLLGQLTGISIGVLIIGFTVYYKYFKSTNVEEKKEK